MNALARAPRLNSLLGDKVKMIRFILFSIVDRTFFSNYTWMGKGANGETKQAFSKYKNVLNLIYTVVRGRDENYNFEAFLSNLKLKIIRYAYE